MQISQTTHQQSQSSFTLTPKPANFGLTQGTSAASGISNITVSSMNGFSGTVTFSQPVTQPWITATLNTTSVTINPSNQGVVALNLTVVGPMPFDSPNCPWIACSAKVNITGTMGSSSQTATVGVLAYGPNFQFSGSQNVPIVQGRSTYVNLTLLGTIYVGPVALKAIVAPGGPKVTISPDRLELNLTRFQYSRVTIDSAGLQLGNYNVTVTATELASPYVYHSVKLDVSVWAGYQAPSQPSVWSLLLNYLPGIILFGFIGVFLIVTLLLDRRARRRNTTPPETAPVTAALSNRD